MMITTTVVKLADRLGVSDDSIRTYICRWEFAHIDIIKINGKYILKNITEEDIVRLGQLINRTKRGKRKKKSKRSTYNEKKKNSNRNTNGSAR